MKLLFLAPNGVSASERTIHSYFWHFAFLKLRLLSFLRTWNDREHSKPDVLRED